MWEMTLSNHLSRLGFGLTRIRHMHTMPAEAGGQYWAGKESTFDPCVDPVGRSAQTSVGWPSKSSRYKAGLLM